MPLLFHPASEGSVFAFVVIVAVVIAMFLAAVHHACRTAPDGLVTTLKIAVAVGGWLGLLNWLVASGRLQAFPLHGLPFFFLSILLASFAVALSPLGTRLADTLSLAALVGFQSFRLPLELVLHEWAAQGTIPGTMTWTGQNWDIVSGIVCFAAAPWATATASSRGRPTSSAPPCSSTSSASPSSPRPCPSPGARNRPCSSRTTSPTPSSARCASAAR